MSTLLMLKSGEKLTAGDDVRDLEIKSINISVFVTSKLIRRVKSVRADYEL